MSNPCRCFHTTFGCAGPKLLIRLADHSVAEGRQATAPGTRSDTDRCKLRAAGCNLVAFATRARPGRLRTAVIQKVREICSEVAGFVDGMAAKTHPTSDEKCIWHCVLSLIFHITSALGALLYPAEIQPAVQCELTCSNGRRWLAKMRRGLPY